MEATEVDATVVQDYIFVEPHGKGAPNGKPAPIESEPNLPRGWEKSYTKEGEPYYIDHNAKITTFHHPGDIEVIEGQKSQAPLPPHWEMRLDKDKRPYYIDHENKTTTWVRPVEDDRKTTVRLPKGWERRLTEDGTQRLYFVDQNTKRTTWTCPVDLESDKSVVKDQVEESDRHA